VASPVLPCALVCLRPCPPGPCQRRTAELIMFPDAGCYRVPGNLKILKPRLYKVQAPDAGWLSGARKT
jgi:hypothetical protein